MNVALKVFAAWFLCATAAFGGDDEEKDGRDMRPLVYVDEKNIENKSSVPNANFGGMIDRLNNALTESGMYRVLTPKDIGAGLVDDELFKRLATDGGKESTLKTPGFRICLTILQYGYAGSSGANMYGRQSVSKQAMIELILKVIDVQSRETVKSKNLARSASGTSSAQTSNMSEQVLQEANRAVVDDIVKELVKITPFNILDVENTEVVVDVPSNRVRPGQQLTVYKRGKKVRNKRTGKLTSKESQVATIGVVTLSEDSVTCKLLSGVIAPEAGAAEGSEYDKYIVRIPDAPANATDSVPAMPPTPSVAVPF